MKVGDEVFFAKGESIRKGIVTKVLGTQLRVEFMDFVVVDEYRVVPVPAVEHPAAPAPVIGKKKKK